MLEKFGEYDEKGNLIRDPRTCILTGRKAEGGDMRVSVGRYFYYVSASVVFTPELKAQIESVLAKPGTPVKAAVEKKGN